MAQREREILERAVRTVAEQADLELEHLVAAAYVHERLHEIGVLGRQHGVELVGGQVRRLVPTLLGGSGPS